VDYTLSAGILGDFAYISDVLHKAFIDVAENGTETAAATAVVISTLAIPPDRATGRRDPSLPLLSA
jgi:serine protease inhibitor